MKSLITAIIGLTIAAAASPGTAYVAEVVTSIPVTNSADDEKQLEAALEAAIKDMVEHDRVHSDDHHAEEGVGCRRSASLS